MSGQIRITPEAMRGRASEFLTEQENFMDVVAKMTNLVDLLQDEWEGAASSTFKDRFQDLQPGFQKVQELIGDIAEQLTDTAKALEDLDLEISNKMNGR